MTSRSWRYVARLSAQDHVTDTGEPLHRAAEILAQDRANFHRFGLRDREDEADPYFATAERRRGIEDMLDPLSGQARQDIVSGEPLVRCMLYRVRDRVRLDVTIANASASPPDVASPAPEAAEALLPLDTAQESAVADGSAAGAVEDGVVEPRPDVVAPETAVVEPAGAPSAVPSAPAARSPDVSGRNAPSGTVDERGYRRHLQAFLDRARDGTLPDTESGGFFAAVLLGPQVEASRLDAVMALLSRETYASLPTARFLRNYLALFAAAGADRTRGRLAEDLATMRALYEGDLREPYLAFIADARGLDAPADAVAFVEGALGLSEWYAAPRQ